MIEIDLSISLGTIIAIFISFIAIITLGFIVYFEYKREKDNKNALLNSLFDEIHHNLNIARGFFFLDESDDFLASVCHELERLYGIDAPIRSRVYPNPSDNVSLPSNHPNIEVFFRSVQLNTAANIPPGPGAGLIEYHTFSIEKALSSGIIWHLAGKRVSQNLGHLYYSLKRIDLLKKRYMNNNVPSGVVTNYFNTLGLNNRIDFHKLIFQYWLWLHFRLWFLYLDLALSSKEGLIDHNHLDNIRCRIGESEWKRLHKILRKTRNR